jgi:hypothetical protein
MSVIDKDIKLYHIDLQPLVHKPTFTMALESVLKLPPYIWVSFIFVIPFIALLHDLAMAPYAARPFAHSIPWQ